ncbi:GNAT family N-acetyltransferase [Flavobacterium sp. NKUCC04_CG]|uniref:GNAT family N-acetyltransferase n=1 Tax=Flavobacterium sp. NKUCC04_CG TaxID=2842121 RepID=UPI001C5B85D4|nr:GNAT family N-acetyltransferase [Flavobacterium sp. NKUCC04_CG]MBW3518064.1 GNAT family N-acetyltransferase [Flavobacterium sp. NKUCC04_CG]
MNIKIETERLYLREMLPSDEDGLFELDSNPAVHTYLGNNPITKIDEAAQYIEFVQQQYKENGVGRWAVIDKVSGEFIGWSGIKLIKEPMNNHLNFYEIGYRFIEKHWGKGFATETTTALLAYAFEHLKTAKVYAICHIENLGSKNVLLKSGLNLIETFDFEGTEHNWFEISKEEWLDKKA